MHRRPERCGRRYRGRVRPRRKREPVVEAQHRDREQVADRLDEEGQRAGNHASRPSSSPSSAPRRLAASTAPAMLPITAIVVTEDMWPEAASGRKPSESESFPVIEPTLIPIGDGSD